MYKILDFSINWFIKRPFPLTYVIRHNPKAFKKDGIYITMYQYSINLNEQLVIGINPFELTVHMYGHQILQSIAKT